MNVIVENWKEEGNSRETSEANLRNLAAAYRVATLRVDWQVGSMYVIENYCGCLESEFCSVLLPWLREAVACGVCIAACPISSGDRDKRHNHHCRRRLKKAGFPSLLFSFLLLVFVPQHFGSVVQQLL